MPWFDTLLLYQTTSCIEDIIYHQSPLDTSIASNFNLNCLMHHPLLSKCLERRILNEFVNNVERVTDDLIVCIFLAIDSRVFYIGL